MSEYTPKARPVSSWDSEELENWLEWDLYDAVCTHVEEFITKHDNTHWLDVLQLLRRIVTWGKLA